MENSEIYQIIKSEPKKPNSNMNVWLLLVVSLFAFMGAGLFSWSLEFLVLLAIAILIHELGHLLAMKIFKYKNLKMMFLPFLGGVASGESTEQDAFKIAMISIFGPVIGFVSCLVSAVLGAVTNEKVFFEYAYLALYINAFNLLPIMPLDGGQFLNETLFNRFPKAELIFKILAIIGLGCLSYFFGSWVFGVIALFMLITIGFSYQMAKIARDLRNEAGFKDGDITEEKIDRIRKAIKWVYPQFDNAKNTAGLINLIKGTWLRVNKTFPSVPITVLLVFTYIVVTFGFSAFTWAFIFVAEGNEIIPQVTPVEP
jgi:Zn-dependent protease